MDRLRKSYEFKAVFKGGKRIALTRVNVVYLKTNSPQWRFGLSVSRRVGNAVKRNRVKRILREAVKRLADMGQGYAFDMVIIAKPLAVEASMSDIYTELMSYFGSRINKME